MRTIYDLVGNDITTNVQTDLQNNRSFWMCNLYTFIQRNFWGTNSNGGCGIWTYTDFDRPLMLQKLQLFGSGVVQPTSDLGSVYYNAIDHLDSTLAGYIVYTPQNIQRSKLVYNVGLDANDVDITWYLDDTVDYFSSLQTYSTLSTPNVSVLSMRQAMATYRAFDDCPFWIHRGIFTSSLPVYQGALVGAFTDNTGQIQGIPFLVGNGTNVVVPAGATQLQLGVSDYPVNDNQGSWFINVNGISHQVNGTNQPWQFTGGINSAFPFTYDVAGGAQGPVVITGFSTGQSVNIQWITGWINLHAFSEVFPPIGRIDFGITAANTAGVWCTSNIYADRPILQGTCLMYRGFIRKTEASPKHLKITLGSLMQIIQDLQVPTQLILPGSRNSQFLTSPTSSVSISALVSVISPIVITFTTPSGVAANALKDNWMTFIGGSASLTPANGIPPTSVPGWRIQSNTAAAAAGNTTITFYDPPIIPGTPGGFNIYQQTSGNVPGFSQVPPPEVSL